MRICGVFCFLFLLVGLSAAQDTNFAVGPQYLLTGSPLFARPIATPTLSLGSPQGIASSENSASGHGATYATVPELSHQADLLPIYYGDARVSVVEVSISPESNESLAALPASIMRTGVTELVDMPALRLRGYGVTLPEASAYWKAHKATAAHHYTNADIERLHSAAN